MKIKPVALDNFRGPVAPGVDTIYQKEICLYFDLREFSYEVWFGNANQISISGKPIVISHIPYLVATFSSPVPCLVKNFSYSHMFCRWDWTSDTANYIWQYLISNVEAFEH